MEHARTVRTVLLSAQRHYSTLCAPYFGIRINGVITEQYQDMGNDTKLA